MRDELRDECYVSTTFGWAARAENKDSWENHKKNGLGQPEIPRDVMLFAPVGISYYCGTLIFTSKDCGAGSDQCRSSASPDVSAESCSDDFGIDVNLVSSR